MRNFHFEEGITVWNRFLCDCCGGIAHECASGCYQLGEPLQCNSCGFTGILYVKLWDKLFGYRSPFSGKKPATWKCIVPRN